MDQAIFVLAVFLVAFRREILFKLLLGEVRDYFTEASKNVKILHVVLPLRGDARERQERASTSLW